MLRGGARGLVATPWFAAATGFVLAASLWIYSPHAELRFPSAEPDVVLCTQQHCASPSTNGSGSLTVQTPGVPIPRKHASSGTSQKADAKPGGAAASGLTFTYTVLWQQKGTFDAMVSIAGKAAPAHWQLSFHVPGDTITYVMGANWLPSADRSGGVASALSSSPGPWGTGPGDPHEQGQHGVLFMVVGDGTPVTPSGCFYNGAHCTFTLGSPPPGHAGQR